MANASDMTATNIAAYLPKSRPRLPRRSGSLTAAPGLFAIGFMSRWTYNVICNHVEQSVYATGWR